MKPVIKCPSCLTSVLRIDLLALVTTKLNIYGMIMPRFMCDLCNTRFRVCGICSKIYEAGTFSFMQHILHNHNNNNILSDAGTGYYMRIGSAQSVSPAFAKGFIKQNNGRVSNKDAELSRSEGVALYISSIKESVPQIVFLNPGESLLKPIIGLRNTDLYRYYLRHTNLNRNEYLISFNGSVLDDILKEIEDAQYSCTLCGKYYESGLPPEEIVIRHINNNHSIFA